MLRILLVITVVIFVGIEVYADELMADGKTYFSGGDFRRAANSFELFVRANPESAEGYEWLGKAYYSLGNNDFAADPQMLEKAAGAFKKVLSLKPGSSSTHYDLGMIFICLDDKTEAIKEYELLKGRDKELANRLFDAIRNHSFPPVYRVVFEKDSGVTHVTILGNQVLVPVVLANGSNEVRATLLLDTGATVTSINSEVAARLRINAAQTQKTRGQVAGGGLLDVLRTKVSYISVGPHTKTGMDVAIVEHKGPAVPYEGLLGMNFLRDLRYTIDFQGRTINWRP